MHFQSPQIEINTRFENAQTYKTIFRLDIKWTPIEQKIGEIQIGSNLIHITTKI
jgi:SNF2 family DNA or RNA helicase